MKLSEEQREDVMIKPLPKPDLVKIAKNWVNENHGGTVTQQVFHDLFEEIEKLRSNEQARGKNVEQILAILTVERKFSEKFSSQRDKLRVQLNQAVEILKRLADSNLSVISEDAKAFLSSLLEDKP